MSLIVWIIFGAAIGWIASLLYDAGYRIAVNVAVAVAGAIAGGAIATPLVSGGVYSFNIYSIILAVIGSIIILSIYRKLSFGGVEG